MADNNIDCLELLRVCVGKPLTPIWRTLWRTTTDHLHPLAKVIWSDNLRQVLKREHGKGWSVRDHRGRVQLTRIFEDRSRSAVYLPLTWTADNATAILNTVAAIHNLMDSRKISLKEAARLNTQALAEPATATKVSDKGWDAVAADFLKSRGDRRSSTLRDLKLRVERAVAVINQKPKPRDGMSVLEAYAAAYFKEMAPGGQGRKRNLNDVVAFLQFAVDRCGAPDRFLPPPKDRINELIGTSPTSTTERLTPPIKAEQFTALLDALEAESGPGSAGGGATAARGASRLRGAAARGPKHGGRRRGSPVGGRRGGAHCGSCRQQR